MNLQGSHRVNVRRELVWEALNRPEVLQQATPGCKRMSTNEHGGYNTEFEVSIGAVKGRFTGTIEIKDRVPGSQCHLVVSASGNAGFLNADGVVELKEDNSGTIIEYSGQARVGGLIASVGQRLVDGVAKRLLTQFFRNFEDAVMSVQ